MEAQTIYIKEFESPIGPLSAGATEEGICLLEFDDPKRLKTELQALAKLLNARIEEGDNKYFPLLKKQLDEYWEGKRKTFDIPLVMPGTDFQQSVWKELLKIPYGVTRSYKQQSMALKKPEAIRAVAHANGMNRIAIIIPCHRVIGDNGSLTGYGGGLWRKRWLLDLEAKAVSGQMQLAL